MLGILGKVLGSLGKVMEIIGKSLGKSGENNTILNQAKKCKNVMECNSKNLTYSTPNFEVHTEKSSWILLNQTKVGL